MSNQHHGSGAVHIWHFHSFYVALQQQHMTRCPEISVKHRKDPLHALGLILPKITDHP